MSKQKRGHDEAFPVDEELEAIMRRAKEITTEIETQSKQVLNELDITPEELNEVFEEVANLDGEGLEIINREKEAFKEDMEKVFGVKEYKSLIESVEEEKKEKARKKVSRGARRKWIDMR